LPGTTGLPSIRVWPLLGRTRVAIMLRIVLLPEPDGPSSATNSPRWTLKETSRTASMAVPASWNDLRSDLSSVQPHLITLRQYNVCGQAHGACGRYSR
jgi:hypothetical protein